MADRKVFHESIVPIPVESGPTTNGLMVQPAAAEHSVERMQLQFGLSLPRAAELDAIVARGETVPVESLQKDYGAAPADVDRLVSWLKSNGFTIDQVTPDGLSVYATADVTGIEKALDVNMVRVTQNGFTYTASRNAPSLPIDVGGPVEHIGGLQPFRRARKHGRHQPPRRGNRAGLGRMDDSAPQPSPAVANAAPYLPSEVLKAYGADGIDVTGAGQTIAMIDTFPLDSDLQAFWQQAGVPVRSRRSKRST